MRAPPRDYYLNNGVSRIQSASFLLPPAIVYPLFFLLYFFAFFHDFFVTRIRPYPPGSRVSRFSAQTAVSTHRRQRSHFWRRFVIRRGPLGPPSIPRASDLSCTDTRFFFFKITPGRLTGLLRRCVVAVSPLPYGGFTRFTLPSLRPFPSLFQTKYVSAEASHRCRLPRAPWFALVYFTVKIFFFSPYGIPVR